MKTNDVIKQFNADMDNLMENKRSGSGMNQDEITDLAAVLAEHDPSNESRVEASLRKHMLDRIEKRNTSIHHPIRWQYAALAIIGVLCALFTIPSVRAVAQDIIRVIGDVIVSNAPTDAEEYVAAMQSGTPTSTPDPSIQPCEDCGEQVVGLYSLDEVSQMAGFNACSPQYIPEGYWLATRDVFDRSGPVIVTTDYRMELDPPLQDGLQMSGIIALQQIFDASGTYSWEMNIGEVPIVEVSVNGQPGVWLEQIPVIPVEDETGQWEYERWNRLIWEAGGFTFIIQTNMPSDLLPLEEVMRIAESLQP
jgi:hypothetical protein